MKYTAITIGALLGGVDATLLNDIEIDTERKFLDHMNDHGLSYGTKEELEFRKALYKKTLKFVESVNADGSQTHKAETNKFATMTQEEIQAMMGTQTSFRARSKHEDLVYFDENEDLESYVNWIERGGVTPVKNQGNCGSCWAFSSTGSLEGAQFIKHGGDLISLSEQQLVDCDESNYGCNGGWMSNAYRYAQTTPLMKESDYGYMHRRNSDYWKKCDQAAEKGVVQVESWSNVQSNNAEQLKRAVAQQPVAVAVEANNYFFTYKSGVITSQNCGTSINHAVLVVGYGIENGTEYFLVKNSWGTSWGENGYIKLGTQGNICGVLEYPVFPTVV